jgi:hypothetical protein
MTTVEKFYCTRNRSGFASALEDAKIRANADDADWQVVRHLGNDDYHSTLPAVDAVPSGYVVSCLVTSSGRVIGS